MVAVRHSSHGSYAWDALHDRFWHIPIVPVPVIDPTGAGNCYGGGQAAGWLDTHDALYAGCYGAISASFLVKRYGLPKMTPALMQEARSLLDETLNRVKPL
jgi:sugar/nucleoside kinase (ribokinase family)